MPTHFPSVCDAPTSRNETYCLLRVGLRVINHQALKKKISFRRKQMVNWSTLWECMRPPRVQKCCLQLEHMAHTQFYLLSVTDYVAMTAVQHVDPLIRRNEITCVVKVKSPCLHTQVYSQLTAKLRLGRRADTTLTYGLSRTSGSLTSSNPKACPGL